MYQHKMTQSVFYLKLLTAARSEYVVGKEEQEQVVRRRSTARVRTDRQTVYWVYYWLTMGTVSLLSALT